MRFTPLDLMQNLRSILAKVAMLPPNCGWFGVGAPHVSIPWLLLQASTASSQVGEQLSLNHPVVHWSPGISNVNMIMPTILSSLGRGRGEDESWPFGCIGTRFGKDSEVEVHARFRS